MQKICFVNSWLMRIDGQYAAAGAALRRSTTCRVLAIAFLRKQVRLPCATLLLIGLLAPTLLFAQQNATTDPRQTAQSLLADALLLVAKENRYEEALALLQQARHLDSHNPTYRYEIATIKYQQKKYSDVIGLMKASVRSSKATPDYYRLLGNAYDLIGKTQRATKTYQRGIKRFKKAGTLYAELGGMAYRKGNNDAAVEWWEQGIEKDPNFATNYYWAAQLYCHSSEKLWGLLYAELFMQLEPNGTRNKAISQLLYKTLSEALQAPTDSTAATVSFSEKAQLYLLLNETEIDSVLPFQVLYNIDAQWAMPLPLRDKNLPTLYIFRKDWLNRWLNQQHQQYQPNLVFMRQQQIEQAQHLEAYTYWLLREGQPAVFEQWLQEHRYSFKLFLDWFNQHPLQLDEQHRFYRRQYLKH